MGTRIVLWFIALLMAAGAALCAAFGWFAFRNLFAEYQDNTAAAYLTVAGIWWVVALLLVGSAVLTFRGASRKVA